jgi:hypothetical protein
VARRKERRQPRVEALAALGLRTGEEVRFRIHVGDDRTSSKAHWRSGGLAGVESDGSLRIHDAKGATRSIRVEQVEVRREGRRGALRWRPVPDVIAEAEQLQLW